MSKRQRIRDLEARIRDLEDTIFGPRVSALPTRMKAVENPIIVVPGHYENHDVVRNLRTGENMEIECVFSRYSSPPVTKARITRGIGSVPPTRFYVTDTFVKVGNMRQPMKVLA